MSALNEIVEILVIVDDARRLEDVSTATFALAESIRRTARDIVDSNNVVGPPTGILIRVSRRDFDTAADMLLPLLEACSIGWAKHRTARLLMEAKPGPDEATNPITRHLRSNKMPTVTRRRERD